MLMYSWVRPTSWAVYIWWSNTHLCAHFWHIQQGWDCSSLSSWEVVDFYTLILLGDRPIHPIMAHLGYTGHHRDKQQGQRGIVGYLRPPTYRQAATSDRWRADLYIWLSTRSPLFSRVCCTISGLEELASVMGEMVFMSGWLIKPSILNVKTISADRLIPLFNLKFSPQIMQGANGNIKNISIPLHFHRALWLQYLSHFEGGLTTLLRLFLSFALLASSCFHSQSWIYLVCLTSS